MCTKFFFRKNNVMISVGMADDGFGNLIYFEDTQLQDWVWKTYLDNDDVMYGLCDYGY